MPHEGLMDFIGFSEALRLGDAKRYVDLHAREGQDKDLIKWAMEKLSAYEGMEKSRNGHRLYLRVDMPEISASDISGNFKFAMDDLMDRWGYTDPDYVEGKITDRRGRRVSLQKVLLKSGYKDAMEDFNGSPLRPSASAAGAELMLVFTAHPYDKAGASWGRKWSSCLDPNSDLYAEHGHKHLALVKGSNALVYLTDTGDTNLSRPFGRCALSLYRKEAKPGGPSGHLLWPDDTAYGVFPRGLFGVLKKIMGRVFLSGDFSVHGKIVPSSDYEGAGKDMPFFVSNNMVVDGPLDIGSLDEGQRAYLEAKYGGVFEGDAMVFDKKLFEFPYGGELYGASELPFRVVLENSGATIVGTDIVSLGKLSGSCATWLKLRGMKKLVSLSDLGDLAETRILEINGAPSLESLGLAASRRLVSMRLVNTPKLVLGEGDVFSRLNNLRFVQRGAFLCSPFGFDAPNLKALELDVDDLEETIGRFAVGSHVRDAYPTLGAVYLLSPYVEWVPDYLLAELDMFVYVFDRSPLGKLMRALYPQARWERNVWGERDIIISGAIKKKEIYWDKLPRDHPYLYGPIEKPKSGFIMGKKII